MFVAFPFGKPVSTFPGNALSADLCFSRLIEAKVEREFNEFIFRYDRDHGRLLLALAGERVPVRSWLTAGVATTRGSERPPWRSSPAENAGLSFVTHRCNLFGNRARVLLVCNHED